eukprot:TRINITY_DN422_c0_g1_i2.p1 TRINITY_DN422_c0_g1~~TRINITY_DN422_c0_g1_i2.p1  ORF type:complete len:240 (-),score=69.91 TRINITY_DN422_c0_g1_i2:127-813(-)
MFRTTVVVAASLAALACIVVSGQDPAQGWLGYAALTAPGHTRITYIEAKWVVPQNPKVGGAFFSPWFGIESSDNLNLIQPVNPWSGNGWSIYNEYFQWKPVHNINSNSHKVNAGDVVYGNITYVAASNLYRMVHSSLKDNWSVQTDIPIQKDDKGDYKNFTIVYFVMEKEWKCAQYPPNNEVTFYDIRVDYDGQTVANPTVKTAFVDDVCNCRAKQLNSTSIQITWQS